MPLPPLSLHCLYFFPCFPLFSRIARLRVLPTCFFVLTQVAGSISFSFCSRFASSFLSSVRCSKTTLQYKGTFGKSVGTMSLFCPAGRLSLKVSSSWRNPIVYRSRLFICCSAGKLRCCLERERGFYKLRCPTYRVGFQAAWV